MQVAADVAPSAAEYVPAGHGVQKVEPTEAHEPEGHCVQVPAALGTEPGAHMTHWEPSGGAPMGATAPATQVQDGESVFVDVDRGGTQGVQTPPTPPGARE